MMVLMGTSIDSASASATRAQTKATKAADAALDAQSKALDQKTLVDSLTGQQATLETQIAQATAKGAPQEQIDGLKQQRDDVMGRLADATGKLLELDSAAATKATKAAELGKTATDAETKVGTLAQGAQKDAFDADSKRDTAKAATAQAQQKVDDLTTKAAGGDKDAAKDLKTAKADLAKAQRTEATLIKVAKKADDAAAHAQGLAGTALGAQTTENQQLMRISSNGQLVAKNDQTTRAANNGAPMLTGGTRPSFSKQFTDGTDESAVTVGKDKKAVQFKANLELDLDGYPHLKKTKAAAAAKNKEATDKGEKADWLADGTGQSVTSLRWKGDTAANPKSVNPAETPYVALPPQIRELTNPQVKPGDLVAVSYNGRTVYAVYADGGPNWKAGEGSKRLHEALGMPANTGHDPQDVTFTVLPGSGSGQRGSDAMSYADVQRAGDAAFAKAKTDGVVQ